MGSAVSKSRHYALAEPPYLLLHRNQEILSIMQAELFYQGTDPGGCEEIELEGALLRLWPRAFSANDSKALLDTLLETIPWRQETLWIAGQERLVPRLQCWMGDHGSLYGYSGMRLEPEPWNNTVLEIRKQVESLVSESFNSVLLNLYRSGQDSVSWHADDESELGKDPLIASVSLGVERTFELRHKHDKSHPKRQILLPNGSILLMGKGCQDNWLHQLPKVKGLEEPRINLTFRTIKPGRD